MPWCGFWGTGGGLWWVLPLIGLVFMGVMLLTCLSGFGCTGRHRRDPGEPAELRHELERLKDELRKLQRGPS